MIARKWGIIATFSYLSTWNKSQRKIVSSQCVSTRYLPFDKNTYFAACIVSLSLNCLVYSFATRFSWQSLSKENRRIVDNFNEHHQKRRDLHS